MIPCNHFHSCTYRKRSGNFWVESIHARAETRSLITRYSVVTFGWWTVWHKGCTKRRAIDPLASKHNWLSTRTTGEFSGRHDDDFAHLHSNTRCSLVIRAVPLDYRTSSTQSIDFFFKFDSTQLVGIVVTTNVLPGEINGSRYQTAVVYLRFIFQSSYNRFSLNVSARL